MRCLPSAKAAQQRKFSEVSVSLSAFHCRYNSYVNFSSSLSLSYLTYIIEKKCQISGHDNMSSIIWHFWPLGRDILTSEFDINGRRGEESVMNFILTYLNENCSSFEHPLDLPSLPSSIFAKKFTFSCGYYSN